MSHIFIAHVEEDADVALEIVLGLEEIGYRTWCYEVDSMAGASYLVQTGQAVEGSHAVVLVISPNSLGSSQVTKEVVRAHESGKYFLPVLRNITHPEFQQRQPEWREAVGSATSIRIPQEGVTEILGNIIDGLKSLGIHPGAKPDGMRINRIRKALADAKSRGIAGEGLKPPPVIPPEKPEGGKSKKPLFLTLALVAIIAIIAVAVIILGGGGGEQDQGSAALPTTSAAEPTHTAVATPEPTPEPTAMPTSAPTATAKPSAPTPAPMPTPSPTSPSVTVPDLVVLDITWSPIKPVVKNTVTFTVAIINQGNIKAESSYVYYYVDGSYKNSDSVGSINAGATTTESFTWKAELGTHTIKAIVDYTNQIPESDEANNEKEITFSNTLAPDIIIEDITWSPTYTFEGETITFTVTIKNQGEGTAGTSTVYYYIDGSRVSSDSVPSIPGGCTDRQVFTWTAKSGIHIIKAVGDATNRVFESDGTNNSKEVTLSVP